MIAAPAARLIAAAKSWKRCAGHTSAANAHRTPMPNNDNETIV